MLTRLTTDQTLEYASTTWSPSYITQIIQIESVQRTSLLPKSSMVTNIIYVIRKSTQIIKIRKPRTSPSHCRFNLLIYYHIIILLSYAVIHASSHHHSSLPISTHLYVVTGHLTVYPTIRPSSLISMYALRKYATISFQIASYSYGIPFQLN